MAGNTVLIDGYYLEVIAPNTPQHGLFIETILCEPNIATGRIDAKVTIGKDQPMFIPENNRLELMIDCIKDALQHLNIKFQLKKTSIKPI
jgi:hypothetical protein